MKNVVLTILWLFLLSAKSTFAITPIAAYITFPTNSSSLSGNNQVFHFEDPDNIVFSLYVGSTPKKEKRAEKRGLEKQKKQKRKKGTDLLLSYI
jgi:hypothetical protein